MVIYHTTYEEARSGGHTTTAQSGADILKRSHRETETRRPVSLPSHQNDEYTIHCNAVALATRAELRANHPATIGTYGRVNSKSTLTEVPKLRRKENLLEDWRKSSQGRTSSRSSEQGQSIMEQRNLQRAVKAGILERAVHPSEQSSGFEETSGRYSGSCTEVISTTKSEKRKSRSKKVGEYIATTANMLDEKRKSIATRLTPPLDLLNPVYNARNASAASIDSFYCVGLTEEQERENEAAVAAALKKKQREYAYYPQQSFTIEEDTTDGWRESRSQECRICGNFGVYSIRGLCNECERDFRSPKLTTTTTWYSGDDIKPTPPPKDPRPILAGLKRGSSVYSRKMQEDKENPDKRESWGTIQICRQPTTPLETRPPYPI